MPSNGMNVGVDYSFAYYDGNKGGLVDMGDVQTVRITHQKHDIVSRPYNNWPRFGFVPDGFSIDFTITRNKSEWEDWQAAYDAAFQNSQLIAPGYLNETVHNPDGTVSRYQYQNLVAFVTDHGDIARERLVTLRVHAMASSKVALA